MKRPVHPESDADWIREYAWRVRKILTAALRNMPAPRRAWYPRPKNAAERHNYAAMRENIDRVVAYVDECEKRADSTAIERMRQYAAIKALWDGWRSRRLEDFWADYRSQRAKLERKNARAKREADKKAMQPYRVWKAKNRAALKHLDEGQRLKKYLSKHRLPERERKRLRAHVNAEIKKT